MTEMDNNKEEITLTLADDEAQVFEDIEALEPVKEKKIDPKDLEIESNLSPEEMEMVNNFAKQIDITSATTVLQYGSGAQQKIANFSDQALDKVRTRDLGKTGSLISGLVGELKNFKINDEKDNFVMKFFKKTSNSIQGLKAQYDDIDVNVDKIVEELEGHQITLLKDIALLDKLYEKNLVNYKELTMYILAGQKKLKEINAVDLPAVQARAKETGLPEDAQKANDLANSINRFEKKLHDLEVTRVVSIQMAPQIRMVQNNDTIMTEKIQSTLVNTIPLWKSQVLITLGIDHSKEAMQAQREVTDFTNELLQQNAKRLKTVTIETAKESERAIVDLETLTLTNKQLIETLEEVAKIQDEGRKKRTEAQLELRRIERELNDKLVEITK